MPDLPRRRPERPSWIQPIVGRLTPAIKALVIINALVYLTYVFSVPAQPWMRMHLAVWSWFWATRQLWQPVTALFVHTSELAFVSFVFDMIGLWWLGTTVERTQGTRRFLVLYFAAGILANVAAASVAQALGLRTSYDGCSPAVMAVLVAFGRLYGRETTPVFGGLVLQARQVVLFFIGLSLILDLIQGFSQGDWGLLTGTLVAMLVGYIAAAPGGLREIRDYLRVRRLRRRYRVLEGGASRRGRAKYLN
jgi:membrane associated rhomboid family serine protease